MLSSNKIKFSAIQGLLLIFIFSCGSQSFAQVTTEKITVEWGMSLTKIFNDQELKLPFIVGQEYDGYKPNFTWTRKTASNTTLSPVIVQKQLIPATAEDLNYLTVFKLEVPGSLEFNYQTTNARKQRFFVFNFFPFVKETGTIYRVTELDVQLTTTAQHSFQKKDFATESVLNDAASTWYKVSVKSDGIYKLDKAWFESNGIAISGLTPDEIHLYGNANGKLSELNSDPKVDDLAENAMLFVGNSDATFDDTEYFLFYGWGPHKWNETAGKFERDLNIYSDDSYYFIRLSATETPLRITTVGSTSTIENQTVTSFDHYDIYEQELKNLLGGGQRWYGELFDTELAYTFNFSIPDHVSGDTVHFKSSLASNPTTSDNTITYTVGSTVLKSAFLSTTASDYRRMELLFDYTQGGTTIPLTVTVNRSNPSVLTYLDKIEVNARRNLNFSGTQLRFRDTKSVGAGNISKFSITNTQSSYFVWDITDKHSPKLIQGDQNGTVFSFNVASDSLREFVCSNGTSFLTPSYVKRIEAQNLHGLDFAKLVIVTHPDFLSEALNLKSIHEADGTSTHVVTTEEVYNEFSSGMQDPTAIRWFVKMFYDRANGDLTKMPENLLLFGDATFDPKNRVSGNNYFVPTYEVLTSEDHINALVTDDYFGMLDDTESIANSDMMDIGVGRMIISTIEQAQQQVGKIRQYLTEGLQNSATGSCPSDALTACSSFGDWRMKYVQIADDEEGGYFVNVDTETQYTYVNANYPEMNPDKLYLDAFTQVTNAGGERYPEIFDAITDRVQRGSLIVNYVGHGGESGLAEERVVNIPQIQSWTNYCNLNIFVSATCEFTKFDDPARVSAGEWMFLNPSGGAIALMTTTRSVFFGVNSQMIQKFYENVFLRDANNKALTFGEITKNTKNQSGSNSNKRSFNLIGDPALRINLPEFRIVTDSINSFSPVSYTDTLEALSKVTIKGHVEDYGGTTLSAFNGVLTPSIFDKKKQVQTLGQNDDSPVIPFQTQKNVLYKGKATITNGQFEFSFIVPKDINYAYGNGKISLYGNSADQDAGGFESRVIIGGVDPVGLNDNEGPEIDLYFNTEQFINGGLTDENPILIAKLFDQNGINTVGNGIGHDLMAIIDQETANPIVLNDYYNADLDTYQSGQIRYNFSGLAPGHHTLTLKVWDVNNNLSESTIEFEVQAASDFQLMHVLNYPNPFTTNTNFYFEHNQLCSALEVQIQIFTISGKLVKTINQLVYNECYRSDGITWDGRDDYGDQLAKGVYIYSLTVTNPDNQTANKTEKLVILK